jgi:hypothetical protein
MGHPRFQGDNIHPETVLFDSDFVLTRRTLRGPISQAKLCGVLMYASAQSLDFLARTKNPRFPNQKPVVSHPEFPNGN